MKGDWLINEHSQGAVKLLRLSAVAEPRWSAEVVL